MKKKLFYLGLAGVLAVSMSISAFAETITNEKDTQSHEVKATYLSMGAAPTVYAVEITWGSMEFTYKPPTVTRTWDPSTHTYKDTVAPAGTWTNEDGANKITLTNRSNKALTATITAQTINDGTNDYTGIQAAIANPTLSLADASIGATTTTPGTASTAETTISLTGELTNTTANKTPIGNVTVSIADAQGEVTP